MEDDYRDKGRDIDIVPYVIKAEFFRMKERNGPGTRRIRTALS